MLQEEALSLLKMGKNVFLTGEAGSGKTYLLNKYIQYLKDHSVKVAVTASTGIAATHLQGVTIHSWSGIGIKDQLSQKELETLSLSRTIKNNYQKIKVLIIDEISMLHKHQLDMVDRIARYMLNCEEAFGGMQVVLCGDFFQLPPINSNSFLREKYFAFESTAWENGNFHICYLHEQHRQINDPLQIVLNDIRRGTAGEHTKVPLRTRYKKEPSGATKATKLYSRNINVDAINDAELMRIQAPEKTFMMMSEGVSGLVAGLKKSCLAPEILKLKIGAEVMFVKNDLKGKYVNGTRGIIIGFDKDDNWPIVKTYHDETFTVYPDEWKYEENEVVRATIRQVPLRLAWAITIHKSQGMTLDAAEIDLGDAFEPGMGYVALSRVRSLSGLKLMNLNEMALKVHPKILVHDKDFKENSLNLVSLLQKLSKEEITAHQQKTLLERFEGSTDKPEKILIKKKPQTPTHFLTLELLKENLSLEDIAEKRGFTIGTILTHLEKLKGLKLIDDNLLAQFKNRIAATDFEIILNELKNSAEGKLKPIHDKFEGKYSYRDIQFVRLFLDAG